MLLLVAWLLFSLNKSINKLGFTPWSVSVMILSTNDYRKSLTEQCNTAANEFHITVNLRNVYFIKSLQEDLHRQYLFLWILLAKIGWTELRKNWYFWWIVEPVISVVCMVNFDRNTGFSHDLCKVVCYNQLQLKSSLILTIKYSQVLLWIY